MEINSQKVLVRLEHKNYGIKYVEFDIEKDLEKEKKFYNNNGWNFYIQGIKYD